MYVCVCVGGYQKYYISKNKYYCDSLLSLPLLPFFSSQVTPLTAMKFAELSVRAGFPPGVINILPGKGEEYFHMEDGAVSGCGKHYLPHFR